MVELCQKILFMISFVPKLLYSFFWLPWRIGLNFFVGFERESKENLKELEGPLIIVSNHICWMDPFIIGASFPFRSKIFPIRYACLWKYFYFPLLFPFIWAFGSFPVRKGRGLEKALSFPLKILKKGGVVGIFPRGQKEWKGVKKPKRGAAFLALKTGTKILPIKIEAPLKMKFLKIILRKYKIKVKIGKIFILPDQKIDPPELLNDPAEYIMKKSMEL